MAMKLYLVYYQALLLNINSSENLQRKHKESEDICIVFLKRRRVLAPVVVHWCKYFPLDIDFPLILLYLGGAAAIRHVNPLNPPTYTVHTLKILIISGILSVNLS